MPSTPQRIRFYHSIVFKNLLLFLGILLVAIIPLALRYYQDSRDYEIQNWASKLEFFAERGASWLDVEAITRLTRPEQMRSPAYQKLLATLQRITREFAVDDAVVMRRNADGRYTYVAIAHGYDVSQPPLGELNAGTRNPCNPTAAGAASNPCSPTATRRGAFDIGQPVHIHSLFPATYQATNDTWLAGEMMHSQLFGGKVGDQVFDQFLQVNTPLKHNGKVVAILMLNKFANPLAAAVRAKTLKVVTLSVSALIIGLTLFGFISARMLRPLQALTLAANAVAQGNLDLSVPVPHSRDEVGRLAETFQTMLTGLRQRDFIRDTFGRYLSPEIVAELLESPDGLKLGGETRELTLLVSDLRGFTTLASRLSPQEVITLLNRYLERMVDIITRYRGTVDEFQGDGILAFFGAPLAADDDPERAVACAIAMQRALVEINAEQRQRNLPELAMGIGINTGEVVVGNIGSEKRTKYGAVGSAINTAYRIESYTVGGQILISPSVYERVRSIVQIRGTLQVRFKGLDQPITLYDVIGLQGKYALSLPEKPPEACTPLDQPIPIVCYPVEGKAVSEQAISGYITGLAESV
ncbi:MAG: adenylate/guanylate cyclase domain-containing protein, partial [Nitrospinota bacterium]